MIKDYSAIASPKIQIIKSKKERGDILEAMPRVLNSVRNQFGGGKSLWQNWCAIVADRLFQEIGGKVVSIRNAVKPGSYHAVLLWNGRYYDASAQQGVKDWKQLRFFKELKKAFASETIPLGQCFPFAYEFMKKHKNATLVHAEVYDQWKKKWYWHAWVEWNGKVYDWQTHARPEGPLSVKDFREIFTPRKEQRYDYTDTLLNAFKSKHYGPWI